MNVLKNTALYLCLTLAAGCNENNNDDSSQRFLGAANTKPNTPTVPTPNTSKALLSVSGGSLTEKENTVTFPASVLTTGTFVELSVTADKVTNSQFDDGIWLFEQGTILSPEELRIKVEKPNFSPSSGIKLKIKVPNSISSQINSQTNVVLLYLDTFERKGDESENIDSVLSIPIAYDAATQSITATAPVSVFRSSEDGSASVVFKVALIKKEDSSTSLQMMKSAVSVLPTNEECKTPIPTESENAASTYANPLKQQLKIVGPYSEQDTAHSASKHGGIDFAVSVDNSVYSVRSGYIAKIKEATCSDCSNPLFYIVVRHPDGSATRYLHLKRFSAVDTKGNLIKDGTKKVKDESGKEIEVGKTVAETQVSWQEKNSSCPKFPVSAGDKIALSGMTATSTPHLHFEAATKIDLSSGFGINTSTRFNPIMSLGKVGFDKPIISLSPNKPKEEVAIIFQDNTNRDDILVRRKKPAVYLPIAAQGDNFEQTPPLPATGRSDWPVIKVLLDYNDDDINKALENGTKDFSKQPPNKFYKQRQDALKTDEGFVEFGIGTVDLPDAETKVMPEITVSAVEDAVSGSPPEITGVGVSQKKTIIVNIKKLVSATLALSDTNDGWVGLPANISLTGLTIGQISTFESVGNSSTCGTGERGVPLFSNLIDQSATFYAAKNVSGVPSQLGGPSINRNNCSSFVAIKDISDPTDATKPKKQRIWINATGRAWRINASAGVTSDWEYQVRYDSGDPFNSFAGKSCTVGTVPNSGVFSASWSSNNCAVKLE